MSRLPTIFVNYTSTPLVHLPSTKTPFSEDETAFLRLSSSKQALFEDGTGVR